MCGCLSVTYRYLLPSVRSTDAGSNWALHESHGTMVDMSIVWYGGGYVSRAFVMPDIKKSNHCIKTYSRLQAKELASIQQAWPQSTFDQSSATALNVSCIFDGSLCGRQLKLTPWLSQ